MRGRYILKIIYDEIEKIGRGFLWGNTNQGRKSTFDALECVLH
jgi:hypothetical protein